MTAWHIIHITASVEIPLRRNLAIPAVLYSAIEAGMICTFNFNWDMRNQCLSGECSTKLEFNFPPPKITVTEDNKRRLFRALSDINTNSFDLRDYNQIKKHISEKFGVDIGEPPDINIPVKEHIDFEL